MDCSDIPEAGAGAPGHWSRIAWLPIPLLVAAILALWVPDLQMVWNAPFLQGFCFYAPPVLGVFPAGLPDVSVVC